MQPAANVADTQSGLDKLPAPEQALKYIVPDYALLFFDHLHSEYLALKPGIQNQSLVNLLESIYQKRMIYELTWSDIYTFDLMLVDERPLENLIRKAYDARSKYRSIAGQKEYAEYLASKPPNLTAILIEPNNKEKSTLPINSQPPELLSLPDDATPEFDQMSQSADIITRVLRADVRYLLSKFYLYYAMLPMREGMREVLTRKTVTMTIWILVMLSVLLIISFGGSYLVSRDDMLLAGPFAITVSSVAYAGVIGGCISMLQRIQSAPVEGDALFNLAALANSWTGLSLSPLYGAVFASLLFVLFAAGILQGAAFPKIETISISPNAAVPPAIQSGNSDTTGAGTASSPNPNATSLPVRTDTERTGILQMKDFVRGTGPRDGVSFALLVIWSFIAGFAERLVPDILNRFIAKTETIPSPQT
ncbi:MAG TPA: hypothetical protein VF290_06850 [Pyrinomonadaceae bacterium]